MTAPAASDPIRAGIVFALLAYGAWGVAPAYWKQLEDLPPFEILAYRVLSSAVVGLLLLTLGRSWRALRDALGIRRVALVLSTTALIIGGNWFLFLYAVVHDRIVDTSLGYFLTPLLNVALGRLFLGERLRLWQGVAVALAAVGVARLAFELGGLPWISLALGGSFACYGLLRKWAPVPSLVAFATESSILAPLAGGYLAWLAWTGAGSANARVVLDGATGAWLAGTGLMTAGPLVWFASAARRLPLSVVGLFQYIAPTVSLGLAVLVYGEPFLRSQLEAFGCIWLALAVYTWDWRRAASEVDP
ncbi:MAG: EamA family transporter RarD [Myxococcota bacterium]